VSIGRFLDHDEIDEAFFVRSSSLAPEWTGDLQMRVPNHLNRVLHDMEYYKAPR
jgi:hypothetical protein